MWRLAAADVYAILVLLLCSFGYSSAEECVLSNWTELTGNDTIQHRVRMCGANITIESRNCGREPCDNSTDGINADENLSADISPENNESTTTVKFSSVAVNLRNSTILQNSPLTTQSYGGSSTNPRRSSHTLDIFSPLSSKPHEKRTGNHKLITVDFIKQTKNHSSNASTPTRDNGAGTNMTTLANNFSLILGNDSQKSDSGHAACKQGQDQQRSGLGFVAESVLITVLVCLLVIAVVGFWCERQKRLKHQRDRAYIFSLPSNTELTSTRESDFHYSSMMDFIRLFDESRAGRLSSCIYQDITEFVSSEFSSPRSTYQQIPCRASLNSLSENSKSYAA